MTPAQASPGFDYVTDVPVQGPTNETMREASCWFAQNVVPARQSCVDCGGGTIPMWTQQSISPIRGASNGVGERVSFGGRVVGNFALAKAGDPSIWETLTPAQQQWVMEMLVALDAKIREQTGTSCATFGPSITAAGGCFQAWYNANYLPINPQAVPLRIDGAFDQDTLDGLRTVAVTALGRSDPFPGTTAPGTTTYEEKKKLSTGAMIGIGVVGAAAIGGLAWAATRKRRR